MAPKTDYSVARVDDKTYRLDRRDGPFPGPVAFIRTVRDRMNSPIGWRLKPIKAVRGASGRLWASPADAIAATQLMTKTQATVELSRLVATTAQTAPRPHTNK